VVVGCQPEVGGVVGCHLGKGQGGASREGYWRCNRATGQKPGEVDVGMSSPNT